MMRSSTTSRILLLPLLAAAAGVVALGRTQAQAADAQSALVTDVASTQTPRVVGGQCYGSVADPGACRKIQTMVKIGDWIYAGGIIDKVANNDGSTVRSGFSNLFRFSALTKALDPNFQPQLYRVAGEVVDSEVTGLAASADGSGIYVSGRFTTVKSSPVGAAIVRKGLVQLDASTGAVRTGFAPKICVGGGSCNVSDVRLVGQTLWVGGDFSFVAGTARAGLASLEPTTGALTSAITIPFSGRPVTTTAMKVVKIKVNPALTRAVVLGNFGKVGTLTHEEVVLLNVNPATGAATGVNSWNAPTHLHAAVTQCNPKLYWPRDADWSPDGTFFVVVGTGGGGGHPWPAPCDAFTRWEDNGNANSTPTGYNHTEIDTILSVCNVGQWSYLGGHFKSLNQERRLNGVLKPPPAAQVNETHYGMGVLDTTPTRILAVTSWNHSDQTGRGEGWGAALCVPGAAAVGGGVYLGGDSIGVNGNPQIERLAYFRAAS